MRKNEKYKKVIKILESTLISQPPLSLQGKMSLMASILHSKFDHWTFCGFYVIVKPDLLEIGPYQGHVLACSHIKFGRGVCGIAAKEKRTIIVDDVKSFPDYISCDPFTRSEIVIPVYYKKQFVAVLDIDSPTHSDFDEIDQAFLETAVSNM